MAWKVSRSWPRNWSSIRPAVPAQRHPKSSLVIRCDSSLVRDLTGAQKRCLLQQMPANNAQVLYNATQSLPFFHTPHRPRVAMRMLDSINALLPSSIRIYPGSARSYLTVLYQCTLLSICLIIPPTSRLSTTWSSRLVTGPVWPWVGNGVRPFPPWDRKCTSRHGVRGP